LLSVDRFALPKSEGCPYEVLLNNNEFYPNKPPALVVVVDD
jgi:hypothetical protein